MSFISDLQRFAPDRKVLVALAALVVGLGVGAGVDAASNVRHVALQNCVVLDKSIHTLPIIGTKAETAKAYVDYVVDTTCGHLSIRDSITASRWNSSTLYGQILVGHGYDFDCVLPVLPWMAPVVVSST